MDRIPSYRNDPDWHTLNRGQKSRRRNKWRKNPQYVDVQRGLPNLEPVPQPPQPRYNECGICFDPTSNKTFCCKQYYCLDCLVKWDQKRSRWTPERVCPHCRRDYMKSYDTIKEKIVNYGISGFIWHVFDFLFKLAVVLFVVYAAIIILATVIVVLTDQDTAQSSRKTIAHWKSAMECVMCRILRLSDESMCTQCQTVCAPIPRMARECLKVLPRSKS